jgi:hypothetical protein
MRVEQQTAAAEGPPPSVTHTHADVPMERGTSAPSVLAQRRFSAPNAQVRRASTVKPITRPASAINLRTVLPTTVDPPSLSVRPSTVGQPSLSARPSTVGRRASRLPAPVLTHDEFYRTVMRGPPSPLKASVRAAQHICAAAQRRVPLQRLLNGLEDTVLGSGLLPSPEKRASLAALGRQSSVARPELGRQSSVARPELGRQSSVARPELGRRSSSARIERSELPQRPRTGSLSHPPLQPAARSSGGGGGGSGSFHSSRKHVIELYEAFVVRREVRHARSRLREADATAATARAKEAPDAGSFVDVLKLYYPHFSRATLGAAAAPSAPVAARSLAAL